MMRIYLFLLLSVLVAACDTSNYSEKVFVQTDSVLQTNKQEDRIQITKEKNRKKSAIDFLSGCDSLEIWKGAIQGVPQSDSTGIYIMAQCASNMHFDLIVYSERELTLDEASDRAGGTVTADIKDAAYYAFKIPKRKSINLEEELDTYDYFFPCEVDVYKYFADGWYLIQTKSVKSFEELGRLKLNALFTD